MENYPHLETEFSTSSIIDEIETVASEGSEQNWDGYQSEPIGDDVVRNAKNLISYFPKNIAQPDIVPEPDGSIGFEWDVEKDKWMIVSVDDRGNKYFAVNFDENSNADGKIDFNDEKFALCSVNWKLFKSHYERRLG